MSNNDLDKEDKSLVSFLKNNAPDTPAPPNSLEDRIMEAIEKEASPTHNGCGLGEKLKEFFKPHILIPASVVLGVLIAAIILPLGGSEKKDSAEMSETASFVEYVWETGFNDYWDNDLTKEIDEIMEL